MNDINIEADGDLAITSNNDLDLLSPEEAIALLVRRAIETPAGYIARYSSDEGRPFLIDQSFGDFIYTRLSEPSTYGLLSNARNDIIKALSEIGEELKVVSVDVGLSANLNEIYVTVDYLAAGIKGEAFVVI